MVVAAAVGFARALRPHARAAAWFLGGFGARCFIALAVTCFLVAVAMSRRGAGSMARLSSLCGLAVFFGFFGPLFLPMGAAGMAGMWFAVVVGFAWLAVTSVHLYRAAG